MTKPRAVAGLSETWQAEDETGEGGSVAGVARLGYRPALDGLRGIAIAVVVGYHLGWPGMSGGFLGVDLFFVLSGFLITRLACDEIAASGTFDLRAFYRRRATRLLPALVAVAAVCAALIPLLSGPMVRETALSAVGAVTYSTNWMKAAGAAREGTGLLWHAWSLAIEEQFYLVWPLVMLWALRRGRTVLGLAVAAAAVSAGLRVVAGLAGVAPEVLYYSTLTRVDGIMVGCAVGAATRLPPVPKAAASAAACLWVGLVTLVPSVDDSIHLTLTASVVASVVMLVYVLDRPPGWLRHPALVRLGRLSYGLYLWHQPVFKVGRSLFPVPSVWRDVVMVAVAWGLTEVSWATVERVWSRKPVDRQEVAPVGSQVQRPA